MFPLVVKSKSGLDTLDHYLDDFIFAGVEGTNNCQLLMDTVFDISSELGVPIAENKTLGSTTCITFLGLDIDTLAMVVKIAEDKLLKLKLGVEILLEEKKVKLRELESITGLMAFCSRAIPSARAFTRRFYVLIASVKYKKTYYYIRITQR